MPKRFDKLDGAAQHRDDCIQRVVRGVLRFFEEVFDQFKRLELARHAVSPPAFLISPLALLISALPLLLGLPSLLFGTLGAGRDGLSLCVAPAQPLSRLEDSLDTRCREARFKYTSSRSQGSAACWSISMWSEARSAGRRF